MKHEERFYTPEELAALLRVKVGTVYAWSSARKLKFTKLSRNKILISSSDLEDFLAARQVAVIGEKNKGGAK